MLKINYDNNILIETNVNEISIDPIRKNNHKNNTFITHAHKDHFHNSKNSFENILSTLPTYDIINTVFKNSKIGKNLEYNKWYQLDELKYKIINSGHVLGSYSIILEYNSTKITITSDFNTLDTTTTKAIIPEETDILIVESTYGSKKDVFPSRQEEYTRFLKWIMLNRLNSKLPIIAAYPLGKTQEIAKLISDNTNFNIGLTNEALGITKIYKKYGININNFYSVTQNINDLDLLILPPQKITKNLVEAIATTSKKNLVFASTTGTSNRLGEIFKISNHSDINEILNYIESTNAKQVYTYHGKDIELSNIISKKIGCYTKTLKEIKTLEIL